MSCMEKTLIFRRFYIDYLQFIEKNLQRAQNPDANGEDENEGEDQNENDRVGAFVHCAYVVFFIYLFLAQFIV